MKVKKLYRDNGKEGSARSCWTLFAIEIKNKSELKTVLIERYVSQDKTETFSREEDGKLDDRDMVEEFTNGSLAYSADNFEDETERKQWLSDIGGASEEDIEEKLIDEK